MTTTAVATKPDPSISFGETGVMKFSSYGDVVKFADRICRTEFVPAGFRGKAENTAIAIIYGMELGLRPMSSLWFINIVNGNPSLSVQGKMALAYSKNLVEKFSEEKGVDKQGCPWSRCEVKRRGVEGSVTWTYNWAQAKRAGLAEKDNYKKNPEAMVVARARGRVFSGAFPDVYGGLYSPEEVEEFAAPERPAELVREVKLQDVFPGGGNGAEEKVEEPETAELPTFPDFPENEEAELPEAPEEPPAPPPPPAKPTPRPPRPQPQPKAEVSQLEILQASPVGPSREEALEEIERIVEELRARGKRIRVNPELGNWPTPAVLVELTNYRKSLQKALEEDK